MALRIGFVGVGTMGQAAHLRNYATLPKCEISAIADLRPRLGAEVAQRFGARRVYKSHIEMLENESLDGIVAIQQFSMHAQLLPELLAKRVPVMIEKPLAETVENGVVIAEIAERLDARLFLAYHKRSDPASVLALQQILKWQKTGEVGKLRYIRITMPPGDWIREGFSSNINTDETYNVAEGRWSRYASFVNYYVHQVNLFRYFLQEDFDLEYADRTGVLLVIRSRSGVVGSLEMAPYETSRDWQEQVFIAFEKGWIQVDLPAPMVVNQPGSVTIIVDSEGGPIKTQPSLRPWHAMRCQADYFLKAICGDSTPLCRYEDGLKDLQFAKNYIDLLDS